MNILRKPSPARRVGARGGLSTRLAMFGFALIGLVGFEGCQSSGCGSCGVGSSVTGFTQRVGQSFSNLGARVFHKNKYAASECCDGGTVVGDPGMPAGTIVPGPVIQGPIGTDSVSPELAPASPNATSKPGTGSGAQGSLKSNPAAANTKMSYETERPVVDGPRSRPGRENVAKSLLPAVEAPTAENTTSPNPLDNLPPVELSRDVARRATSAPVPVEAEALLPPSSARTEAQKNSVKKPESNSPPVPTSASAAEPPSATLTLPPIKAALETSVSPGIQRFTAVGPSLAGGSIPTKDGLDWLKEKGYRTFLDLRERQEVDAAFVDEVINRGLRYVPLPLNVTRLDDVRVRRFRDELAQTDARPLFFCDTDGSRPALIWYVHRVTDGGVETAMARREAEEIAPLNESLLQVAGKYIGTRAVTTTPPASDKQLVAPTKPAREASLQERSVVVNPSATANDDSASLLGRSAVLTFTGFNDTQNVKIPEPKSFSKDLPSLPTASQASPKVLGRSMSADRPSSGG